MPIKLIDFQITRPALEISQDDSLREIAKAHWLNSVSMDSYPLDSDRSVPKSLPSASTRAADQGLEEISEEGFLKLIRRVGPKSGQIAKRGLESLEMSLNRYSIRERTEFFDQKALDALRNLYPDPVLSFDHLIHVSCTGYSAPSAAQRLVSERTTSHSNKITHAYHMGCYAAIPAIRMAEGFLNSGDKKVDIMHTELCSLHMNPKNHSPEQLVVQSLFADGYIRYSAVNTLQPPYGKDLVQPGLRVMGHLERIIPDSAGDMTWITADFGMKMTLSRQVPEKISQNIRSFVADLCRVSNTDINILKEVVGAIHPGGPKIIDAVAKDLELNESQVVESRYVLRNYGNMSSATLPHIWKEVLDRHPKGKKVLSLAFGPGLTMFGTIFEIV